MTIFKRKLPKILIIFIFTYFFVLKTQISKSEIPIIVISAAKSQKIKNNKDNGNETIVLNNDSIYENHDILAGSLISKLIPEANFSRQGDALSRP